MGIFVKFECDTCGEYECDCSMEERNKNRNATFTYETPRYSTSEPFVAKWDMICSHIDEKTSKAINKAHVIRISDDGEIFVTYLDGRNDGAESKWDGPYLKYCSILQEKLTP